MKTQGANKVHYDSGPNMTSLVDVVMVILIFLMLAGTFSGSTRFLMSKDAIRVGDKGPIRPDPSQPPDIDIRISVLARGGFIAQCQTPRIDPTSSPQDLKAQLDLVREKMVGGGTPVDKLHIVIRPDRGVKYQDVLQVYQAALQAQYTKVAMATSRV